MLNGLSKYALTREIKCWIYPAKEAIKKQEVCFLACIENITRRLVIYTIIKKDKI